MLASGLFSPRRPEGVRREGSFPGSMGWISSRAVTLETSVFKRTPPALPHTHTPLISREFLEARWERIRQDRAQLDLVSSWEAGAAWGWLRPGLCAVPRTPLNSSAPITNTFWRCLLLPLEQPHRHELELLHLIGCQAQSPRFFSSCQTSGRSDLLPFCSSDIGVIPRDSPGDAGGFCWPGWWFHYPAQSWRDA